VYAVVAPRRTTLADRCYDHLREQLLEGGVRPGERLSVDALCAALHVSRHPVMEAVKRLEFEGFVVIHPQVGCRVVETEASDVHDFFGFFAGAEALCAHHAAEKRTPADVRRLTELSAAVGALRVQAGVRERTRGYRALDEALHTEIRRIGRSRIVDQISERLWHRADFLVTSLAGSGVHASCLERRHGEHEQIVRAIADGRGADAAALMRAHILAFSALLNTAQ
jgi:DNA-binding GntR family transcriptional regulator